MPLPNYHEIIKQICDNLFVGEERRILDAKARLVDKNKDKYPSQPHDGFSFMGKVYDTPGLVRGPRTRVALHRDLVPELEGILVDEEQIWGDRHHISQTLFQLIHFCDTEQDVRDALPECLVGFIPSLKQLSRYREEAYTLQNRPMLRRQYEKALLRIHFYSGTRLLY